MLRRLAPWFATADGKVAQNAKYDWHVLAAHGAEPGGTIDDTMLMSYVLESDAQHDLDRLSRPAGQPCRGDLPRLRRRAQRAGLQRGHQSAAGELNVRRPAGYFAIAITAPGRSQPMIFTSVVSSIATQPAVGPPSVVWKK